jgi:hypothetical protein
VLAVDDVLSHRDEVAPVPALVEGETVVVGKGLFLAVRPAR